MPMPLDGEAIYGAAKDVPGVVIVTLGTGIGSAIINDGVLVNSELSHLEIDSHDAETQACGSEDRSEARLGHMGGPSQRFSHVECSSPRPFRYWWRVSANLKFLPLLNLRTLLSPAAMYTAGIVGAKLTGHACGS